MTLYEQRPGKLADGRAIRAALLLVIKESTPSVDLLVVGAGIVGLAHAIEAHRRGLSVMIIDRDDHAVGASVRNFGHICATAQDGRVLDYAMVARERWLKLGAEADIPVVESGTLVVGRSDPEMDVLTQFAQHRGSGQVQLLDKRGVTDRLPYSDSSVRGGALLPLDLRTDPRTTTAAITHWLADRGVTFGWRTAATALEPGAVLTTRGPIRARKIIIAVGHNVDRLLPDVADEVGLRRCALQMLRVAAPGSARIGPAVLTGLSMLRYAGLAATPAAVQVRSAYQADDPQLLDIGMNLMFTQQDNGDLIIGDTHRYALTHDPFEEEAIADLVVGETARLLGIGELSVKQRWRGVYADSEQTDFLIKQLDPDTRVVSVTSGIGMTTCHGLAVDVLDGLL